MALNISNRLRQICDLVPTGSRICDVGCDHALVDIDLLLENRIEHALAMDVADGPLKIARENISLMGLTDRCEVRKSDGLDAYHPGEADTLIIAGMGGILMRKILDRAGGNTESSTENGEPAAEESESHTVGNSKTNDAGRDSPQKPAHLIEQKPIGANEEAGEEGEQERTSGQSETKDKIAGFSRLILSPQSEQQQVREWLYQNDVGITQEKLIREDDKFYVILVCEPGKRTRKPDWDAMVPYIAGMPEEQVEKAMLKANGRDAILRLLPTEYFRQQMETEFGPCLIAKRDQTLLQWSAKELASTFRILSSLEEKKDTSVNAQKRMEELSLYAGLLQILLFILKFIPTDLPAQGS